MENNHIFIYGAGGHAREMAAHVQSIRAGTGEHYQVAGFVEDGAPEGRMLCGKPVIPGARFDRDYRQCLVVVAVGDPDGRRRIVERCEQGRHAFPALVHPSVDVDGVRDIGDGVVIFRGTTITVDVEIRRHVHVNIGCTISHDAVLCEFATLSPGVGIAGNVEVGPGAFVGIGANIINGSKARPLRIGARAVIGAGACVTGDAEPDSLYVGVPARLKRRHG